MKERRVAGDMKEDYTLCEISDDIAGKKNVLIVDDDVEMLKIFRFYLQDIYNVSIINSGRAAMSVLEEYTPDIVLLDYLMPDCNGAKVLEFMKKREGTKDVPVFFLTGVTDEGTIKECLSFHPAGYIVKPVAKTALLAKLEIFFNR